MYFLVVGENTQYIVIFSSLFKWYSGKCRRCDFPTLDTELQYKQNEMSLKTAWLSSTTDTKAPLLWWFVFLLLMDLLSVTGILNLFLQREEIREGVECPCLLFWSGCQMSSSKVLHFREFHTCLFFECWFPLGLWFVWVWVFWSVSRGSGFGGLEGACLFFFFATKRNHFLFSLVAEQQAIKG